MSGWGRPTSSIARIVHGTGALNSWNRSTLSSSSIKPWYADSLVVINASASHLLASRVLWLRKSSAVFPRCSHFGFPLCRQSLAMGELVAAPEVSNKGNFPFDCSLIRVSESCAYNAQSQGKS